jgi:hypothetical protein
MFLQASVNNRPATPVKVGIVIGTDGHVWTANAESPTSGPVALMAQSKADSLVFLPLRLNGRPVQIRTTVTVMVDDLESQPTHNGSRNDKGPVVLVDCRKENVSRSGRQCENARDQSHFIKADSSAHAW